ncbi:Zinc finger CCHC domain-containing protein 13, partial [Stegodyphus mimosarum]
MNSNEYYNCGRTGDFAQESKRYIARNCKKDMKTCYICGKRGHISRDCEQDERKYYGCTKIGHSSRARSKDNFVGDMWFGPFSQRKEQRARFALNFATNDPFSSIGDYHVSALRPWEGQNYPLHLIRGRGRTRTVPESDGQSALARKHPPRASRMLRTTYTA